ncbi:hypothetical protein GCM10023264_11610 [Sphingomonas daechungensis]|uniref:Transporter n=1 Tax=Sphingomonas daechungensis TaxID=1176646 RepID=A0ABX6SZL1_9SPHN|nr:TorF family putative porin [Sphingomonas daechungensis]QNP42403.1 hypothetical protein H9L15_08750 [Sphingomonas daechungensis]
MRRGIIAIAFGLAAVGNGQRAEAADWSAEAGIVSDYRYRGVSLSGGKPAFQASLSAQLESGAYGELWTSTIKGAGKLELDATVGYAVQLSDKVGLDLSSTFYCYPGDSSTNAFEATASVEANVGPLTGKAGASFAPSQRGTEDDLGRRTSNLYLFTAAQYTVPKSPIFLNVELGRERGAWDTLDGRSKWSWTMGLGAELPNARIGLDYVGTNAGSNGLIASLFMQF